MTFVIPSFAGAGWGRPPCHRLHALAHFGLTVLTAAGGALLTTAVALLGRRGRNRWPRSPVRVAATARIRPWERATRHARTGTRVSENALSGRSVAASRGMAPSREAQHRPKGLGCRRRCRQCRGEHIVPVALAAKQLAAARRSTPPGHRHRVRPGDPSPPSARRQQGPVPPQFTSTHENGAGGRWSLRRPEPHAAPWAAPQRAVAVRGTGVPCRAAPPVRSRNRFRR